MVRLKVRAPAAWTPKFTHEDYPNNRAVLAIENIREVYKERLKKRDFLQESQPRMGDDFPRN